MTRRWWIQSVIALLIGVTGFSIGLIGFSTGNQKLSLIGLGIIILIGFPVAVTNFNN